MMVTDEMVEDFLVTAFEGGSNYWIDSVGVVGEWPYGSLYASECLTRGVDLLIVTVDGERDTLTLVNMKAGIRSAAKHFKKSLVDFYEEHDAGDADVALQMALFGGEVIYG